MAQYYDYIKALHLIFVMSWFAALLYIPRLFVNHIEASELPSPKKEILCNHLKLMAKRLWYIIAWPASILATFFAVCLLILRPFLLEQNWMLVKLAFVVLLILYHLQTHRYFNQLQNNIITKSSTFMRLWNEGATFIMFAVVFLVILKNAFNWVFGVIGVIILGVLLMLGFKIYKNFRDKTPEA